MKLLYVQCDMIKCWWCCTKILNSNLQIRGLESGVVVPLTSMAAHAVDEDVDIELEVNNEVNETRGNSMEVASGSLPFLPPPPPPIRENNHSRVSKFSNFTTFLQFYFSKLRISWTVYTLKRNKIPIISYERSLPFIFYIHSNFYYEHGGDLLLNKFSLV